MSGRKKSQCVLPRYPLNWYVQTLLLRSQSNTVIGFINTAGQVYRLLYPLKLPLFLQKNRNIEYIDKIPAAYPSVDSQWNLFWNKKGLKEKWLQQSNRSSTLCGNQGQWDPVVNRCFVSTLQSISASVPLSIPSTPSVPKSSRKSDTKSGLVPISAPDFDFKQALDDPLPPVDSKTVGSWPYEIYNMYRGNDTIQFLETAPNQIGGAWDSHGILGLAQSNNRIAIDPARLGSGLVFRFSDLTIYEQAYVNHIQSEIDASQWKESRNPVHISKEELQYRIQSLLDQPAKQEQVVSFLRGARPLYEQLELLQQAPHWLFPRSDTGGIRIQSVLNFQRIVQKLTAQTDSKRSDELLVSLNKQDETVKQQLLDDRKFEAELSALTHVDDALRFEIVEESNELQQLDKEIKEAQQKQQELQRLLDETKKDLALLESKSSSTGGMRSSSRRNTTESVKKRLKWIRQGGVTTKSLQAQITRLGKSITQQSQLILSLIARRKQLLARRNQKYESLRKEAQKKQSLPRPPLINIRQADSAENTIVSIQQANLIQLQKGRVLAETKPKTTISDRQYGTMILNELNQYPITTLWIKDGRLQLAFLQTGRPIISATDDDVFDHDVLFVPPLNGFNDWRVVFTGGEKTRLYRKYDDKGIEIPQSIPNNNVIASRSLDQLPNIDEFLEQTKVLDVAKKARIQGQLIPISPSVAHPAVNLYLPLVVPGHILWSRIQQTLVQSDHKINCLNPEELAKYPALSLENQSCRRWCPDGFRVVENDNRSEFLGCQAIESGGIHPLQPSNVIVTNPPPIQDRDLQLAYNVAPSLELPGENAPPPLPGDFNQSAILTQILGHSPEPFVNPASMVSDPSVPVTQKQDRIQIQPLKPISNPNPVECKLLGRWDYENKKCIPNNCAPGYEPTLTGQHCVAQIRPTPFGDYAWVAPLARSTRTKFTMPGNCTHLPSTFFQYLSQTILNQLPPLVFQEIESKFRDLLVVRKEMKQKEMERASAVVPIELSPLSIIPPLEWKGEYDAKIQYGINDAVIDSTGQIYYVSIQSENKHHPLTDSLWWIPATQDQIKILKLQRSQRPNVALPVPIQAKPVVPVMGDGPPLLSSQLGGDDKKIKYYWEWDPYSWYKRNERIKYRGTLYQLTGAEKVRGGVPTLLENESFSAKIANQHTRFLEQENPWTYDLEGGYYKSLGRKTKIPRDDSDPSYDSESDTDRHPLQIRQAGDQYEKNAHVMKWADKKPNRLTFLQNWKSRKILNHYLPWSSLQLKTSGIWIGLNYDKPGEIYIWLPQTREKWQGAINADGSLKLRVANTFYKKLTPALFQQLFRG